MKSLKESIQLVNEDNLPKKPISKEHIEIIKKALPALEAHIKTQSGGVKTKLKLDMSRMGGIIITSNDLLKEGGTLGYSLFTQINSKFVSGNNIVSEPNGKNTLWFKSNIQYELKSGGSNGQDWLWRSIWFDFANNEWIVEPQKIK